MQLDDETLKCKLRELLKIPSSVRNICINRLKNCLSDIQRNLRCSTAQSSAQSRVSSKVRIGYSGLYKVEFGKCQG